MYLNLFNGRPSLNKTTDDWEDGSLWFEFDYVVMEYDATANGIRCMTKQGREAWFFYVEDCVYYDGFFYGACSFHDKVSDGESLTTYNEKAAKVPKGSHVFEARYSVQVDRETLTTSEITVIADDKKQAKNFVTAWVDKHEFCADNRLDYELKIKLDKGYRLKK